MMKTKEFHARVIKSLQRIVLTDRIPLERISDIARAALDIARSNGDEISSEAITQFQTTFPDCRFDHEAREEEEASSREAVRAIRTRIMKH